MDLAPDFDEFIGSLNVLNSEVSTLKSQMVRDPQM